MSILGNETNDAGNMLNVLTLAPNKFIEAQVEKLIKFGTKKHRPVMLWGPPGIGKSDSVKQIQERYTKLTGKPVVLHDWRLSLYRSVDFKGIPFKDETARFTRWLMPKMFDLDTNPNIMNLIFLDEFSYATPDVEVACFQLMLDRALGEFVLPDNTYIMAAGNRKSDKSGAEIMKAPLANRMLHFELTADFESWKEWAYNSNIDNRILGYLSSYGGGEKFYGFNPKVKESVAWPSGRSWSVVSDYIEDTSIDSQMLWIQASIGVSVAKEFQIWSKIYNTLPDPEKIASGADTEPPKSVDILIALGSTMPHLLKEQFKKKDGSVRVRNIIRYITRMHADVSSVIFSDLCKVEGFTLLLGNIPEYKDWCFKHRLGVGAV